MVNIRHLDDSCGNISSRLRIGAFQNNYAISETMIADIAILSGSLLRQSYLFTAFL